MRIDTSGLTAMQAGRVNRALDKQFRTPDGIRSLREILEREPECRKEVTDGFCDWKRRAFNRMTAAEQRAYEARLAARRYYWVNDRSVPKIVYDVVVGPVANEDGPGGVSHA